MAPTASLPEQQPFTFTSPAPSETYEDALDFDYESWIQQSKITNCYSKKWLEDADEQTISRHHREMMLQAVDSLPEEAYELSLRDLSELTLSSRATTTDEPPLSRSLRLSAARSSSPSNTKPRRKKSLSMEGAGFIIKLFMPSPSRAAAVGGGRKKSFSSSMENASSGMGNDPGWTRNHSMPRKSRHDTTNRQSMGCYPFFNSNKYRVKREAGGRLCS